MLMLILKHLQLVQISLRVLQYAIKLMHLEKNLQISDVKLKANSFFLITVETNFSYSRYFLAVNLPRKAKL